MKKYFLLFSTLLISTFSFSQVDTFATLLGSPVNTTGWNLVGEAKIQNILFADNSEVLLCPNTKSFTSGAIFFNDSLNLGKCTRWVADFDFRINDGSSADGFSFCFLDKPPTGYVYGQGLGIPQNANGLKVCFDTWNNCSCNGAYNTPKLELRWGKGYDTVVASGSGVTCYDSTQVGNGECNAVGYPTVYNLSILRQPVYGHARISYNAGTVNVYINGTLYITTTIPLAQQINFTGYLGFTASVGMFNDNHSIRNVVIKSDIPPSDAGLPKIICSNHVDTIGAINNASYVYKWTPSIGLSDTTISNPIVHLINNGNTPITQKYYVYTAYNNATQCTTKDSVVVTINPLPHLDSIVGNKNICHNKNVQYSNSTTGGNWISLNSGVATINNTGLATGLTLDTTTIRYIVTNSYNCTDSVNALLTVRPIPAIDTIKGNTIICVAKTTTLSNDTANGIWKSVNTSLATVNATTGVVTGVAAGNDTIRYTVTSIYGCVDSVEKIITINPLPVINAITGPVKVCAGSNITLANITTNGSWISTNNAVATVDINTGVVTGVAAGNTIIRYIVTNNFGCIDSVQKSILVVVPTTSTTNTSICPSALPYSWNGLTFTTAGSQTAHLTNAAGCDSAATLNLTVLSNTTSTTNTSICPSALPYSWNGLTFTTAGSQTAHLTNVAGCDSAATLNLTVLSNTTSTTNTSICPNGLPYTWNGLTFTTAGSQTAHLTNTAGCDSAATLNLTVLSNTTSTTNTSICPSALPYSWNGLTFTTAGSQTAHLINAAGCDSAATLNLNVLSNTTSTTNTSICPSALPYTWNGLTFTTAGSQTAHLTNVAGCDSAATLVLTVLSNTTSTTNTSICPSALPYSWNGLTFTTAGSQTAHLTNAAGCDSAATLNLTVLSNTTSTTNTSICPSALPYSWNGLTFTTAGSQTAHLTNAAGCDSAATLNLTVLSNTTSTTNTSICPNALPYSWNGLTFTAAGSQTAHLTNAVGCDSAATLNLNVLSNTTSTTTTSICPSALPYSWNGLTFTAAGSQTAHLTNAAGCDSAATLNLNVLSNTTSTTTTSICPSALPYSWNGLTFTAAGSQTAHLTNAAGCDSAATLNLNVLSNTTSTTNTSICPSALPYSWNGLTFTTAGSQTAHLTNAAGCDSAATLNLTVLSNTTSTTNTSICPNALPYTWNGLTFTTAGSQTAHLTNAAGCDSAATLNLTVLSNTTSTTNTSICPNALPYTWNGLTFTTAGSQAAHLTNASGCDSAATLNLNVENFSFAITTNPITAISGTPLTVSLNSSSTIQSSIWQPSNLFASNLNTQTINTPDTSFTINVLATSTTGCSNTKSLVINVDSKNTIFIPNAFNPSNTTNPNIYTFKIYGNTILSSEASIFNQWGERVFKGNNLQVTGWDGKYLGKYLPIGVYMYIIKINFLNGTSTVKKGSVTLY